MKSTFHFPQAGLYIRGRVLLGLLLPLGDVPQCGGDDGHLRRHGRPRPGPHLPPGHRLCWLLLRAAASPRNRWEKILHLKIKDDKKYLSKVSRCAGRGSGPSWWLPWSGGWSTLTTGRWERINECRELKHWCLSVFRLQSSYSREFASAAYFSGDW